MGDHEGSIQIENYDISFETKLTLSRFGLAFVTLLFDENSFFNTLLGLTSFGDYKPTYAVHAKSPGVYTRENL